MRPWHDQNPITLSLVWSALVLAVLACVRSGVPASGAMGSGGIPPTTSVPSSPVVSPSASSPLPSPSPSPTASRPEPVASPTWPPTPTPAQPDGFDDIPYTYYAQAGDTVHALAIRFGVLPEDIGSPEHPLPSGATLIDPGLLLLIPRRLADTGPAERLLPDSEVVFSPHAADFDVVSLAEEYDGYLTAYEEYLAGGWRSGPEVVAMAARDNSVNPRLLLALLEYHSGWLTQPAKPVGAPLDFPLGHEDEQHSGLYRQLTWLSNELGKGYYGWRQGALTEVEFPDGTNLRLAPDLNAGTVALQHYFASRMLGEGWLKALSPEGFLSVYRRLFGDPWSYQHPLLEPGLEQPEMILPFLPGHVWSFTGGPHGAWEREAAWAALDFAPSSSEPGCASSEDWVVAVGPGLVVRTGEGVVVLDLDGDGREQTGWVVVYLHVATRDRVSEGMFVEQGDLLGHPSCEGGMATGTHIHIVRKYNGEWILADGALPFTMSGWMARAGTLPYQGALVKGDEVVLACQCATRETRISR